jgi:Flp pilus assembly protein TadG
MRRSRLFRDERGSAALEFITAGFLLLIPLVYLVVVMAVIQGGALSVEGASRQAARVFVQAGNSGEAQLQARAAVDIALDDFGLRAADSTVRISCRPNPAVCLTRRGFVTVTVTTSVTLPLVPSALPFTAPLSVPLSATSTEQVSRFWGAG